MGSVVGEVVEIDGSVMEGGGQILRMSVGLSALLKRPIRIHGIRAGRSSPGLKAQHLTGINLVREITGGKLTGGTFGSTEISFLPSTLKAGNYSADTKSAGAVCLLAQVALPCAIFSPGEVCLQLCGGTNADMAPQIDEFTEIFLPNVSKFGFSFEFEVVRKGFFPKGGGRVNFFLTPVAYLKPINMVDVGKVTEVQGWSFTAGNLPVRLAERMAAACNAHLKEADCERLRGINPQIESYKEDSNAAVGTGSGIVVVARTSTGCILGGSALGSPRSSGEAVGKKAAEELLEAIETGGTVDKYIQDQMIIFMALADGESKLLCGPLTLHTETAIHIAEKLTGAKFKVEASPGTDNSWLITCRGIGFRNPVDTSR